MQPEHGVRRVFFFESGRLGNQLLQYNVLRTLFPRARLELFGLDALRRAVRTEGAAFHRADAGWASPIGLLRRALGLLARLRLIGQAREVREGDDTRLERRGGLVARWVLVQPTYFQHPRFEQLIPRDFDLGAAALTDAQHFLEEQGTRAGTPVFVHLRRGDYLRFPSPEAPAALTREWTLAALQVMRAQVADPLWVVCSDDLPHVREWFSGEPVLFCERGELGDLAVMSLCRAGVLSPSSYSWWAAWLARRRLSEGGEQGLFVAPRHWCGHRMGRWYPAGFAFGWIHYLD